MKKIIGNIIFIIYAIIAVFVTICLLSYNEFKVTEFGETSLELIDNEELQPNYNKGDLVIVNRDTRIRENDSIFFYKGSRRWFKNCIWRFDIKTIKYGIIKEEQTSTCCYHWNCSNCHCGNFLFNFIILFPWFVSRSSNWSTTTRYWINQSRPIFLIAI